MNIDTHSNLQSLTIDQFNDLMPYQPKTTVKVGTFLITVSIYDHTGKVVLIKNMGVLSHVITYYSVGV